MIKLVTMDSINNVLNIYKSAIAHMEAQNIFQWDDIYPDKDVITDDIESNSMFGYFMDGDLCAVQVLNNLQSTDYSKIDWNYKDSNPLVLHRLCVAPKHQNKGIAKELMLFMEEFALNNNYKTIRFDAFVQNPVSVNLYTRLGYIKSGTVKFRKGDFYCFEKNLNFHQL